MIVFDIETLDLLQDDHITALPREQRIRALKFGCAVTYDTWTKRYEAHMPHQLAHMWNNMIRRDLCGWNIKAFDIPVILSNLSNATRFPEDADLSPMGEIIDLFDLIRQETGRWYSLDTIAEANLGHGKTVDGKQAVLWLRSGNQALIQKAVEYCRDDVELVRKLYERLRRGQPLRLPARPERNELEELRFHLK